MKRTWNMDCHYLRNFDEIENAEFQPSGKFWPDLNNFLIILEAIQHPSFVNGSKIETRYFCSSFQFDEFSFRILCKVAKHSTLKTFGFSNCGLPEGHINYLLEVTENPNIEKLQIDWNPLADPLVFVKILHTDCKLQSLSLKSCDLNNSFFSDLCERLQKNENLTELDLYDNQITNLVPLASVLQVNRTLKSLSLCKNSIRDQDLAPLVGVFGKIRMSALEAEEYKKIEREKATSKYLAGNQNLSKSFTDDLEFNEDSGEYFLIKNKVFRNFNLSLNCCDADHFLRLVLSQVLPSFKILISKNPLPETVKNSLMQAFSGNVIV